MRDNYVSPPSYSHYVEKFILKEHSYFDTSLGIFLQKLFHFIMTRSQARCKYVLQKMKYAMYYFVQLSVCLSQGEGGNCPSCPLPHATASPLPHIVNTYLLFKKRACWVLKSKIFGQKPTYLKRKPLYFVNSSAGSS